MNETIPNYYQRLKASFPGPETKSLVHLEALRGVADHPLAFRSEENESAVMFYVEGPRFVFVDYIAVDVEKRGAGIGTRMISGLVARAAAEGKFMVLEVDPPESEEDRKRIAFYQRLGLQLFPEIAYHRLWSYEPSSPPCQMLLMASSGTCPSLVRQAMRDVYLHIHSWRFSEFYGTAPPDVDHILPSLTSSSS